MFSAGDGDPVLLEGYCHQQGEEENVNAWAAASVGSPAVQMERGVAGPPALISLLLTAQAALIEAGKKGTDVDGQGPNAFFHPKLVKVELEGRSFMRRQTSDKAGSMYAVADFAVSKNGI